MLAMLLALSCATAASAFPTVHVASGASAVELLAATELRDYLGNMSAAAAASSKQAGGPAVVLLRLGGATPAGDVIAVGFGAATALGLAASELGGLKNDSYVLSSARAGIPKGSFVASGGEGSTRGSLFAVYDLLVSPRPNHSPPPPPPPRPPHGAGVAQIAVPLLASVRLHYLLSLSPMCCRHYLGSSSLCSGRWAASSLPRTTRWPRSSPKPRPPCYQPWTSRAPPAFPCLSLASLPSTAFHCLSLAVHGLSLPPHRPPTAPSYHPLYEYRDNNEYKATSSQVWAGKVRPTAAIPMKNPYCSCKLTRCSRCKLGYNGATAHGPTSRWSACHSADAPSPSPLKDLLNAEGRCSRMTELSPAALRPDRRGDLRRLRAHLVHAARHHRAGAGFFSSVEDQPRVVLAARQRQHL